LLYSTEDNIMERKYIRYVASLALATTFALSPMANATEIEFCDASIDVDDAVDARDCYNTIKGASVACNTGTAECAASVLTAAHFCKTSIETIRTIIKECDSPEKLMEELKEVPRRVEAALKEEQRRVEAALKEEQRKTAAAAAAAQRKADEARRAAVKAAREAQRRAEEARKLLPKAIPVRPISIPPVSRHSFGGGGGLW
jgi:ElaB/YqjD/DUF883 family membrane-anchored ribosome-binding protein